MDIRLSSYGTGSTQASPVSRLMASFDRGFRDGVDINLGVGYVNEKTIPVAWLTEAMEAVVANTGKYRQAFNYGGPEGSRNLIASLRRFLASRRVGGLDEDTLARKRLIIGPAAPPACWMRSPTCWRRGSWSPPTRRITSTRTALERKGFETLPFPRTTGDLA